MKRSAGAGWTVTRVMGETPLYPKPRRGVRGEGCDLRGGAGLGACEPGWGGRCGSCARDYEIVKDASRRRAVTTTMPGVCAY